MDEPMDILIDILMDNGYTNRWTNGCSSNGLMDITLWNINHIYELVVKLEYRDHLVVWKTRVHFG